MLPVQYNPIVIRQTIQHTYCIQSVDTMFPRPWQISFLKNNVSTSSSHIKSSKSVRYKIWTVLIKFDTSQILLENCFPEKCRLDYSTVRQEILQGEYFNLEDSEWYVESWGWPALAHSRVNDGHCVLVFDTELLPVIRSSDQPTRDCSASLQPVIESSQL